MTCDKEAKSMYAGLPDEDEGEQKSGDYAVGAWPLVNQFPFSMIDNKSLYSDNGLREIALLM